MLKICNFFVFVTVLFQIQVYGIEKGADGCKCNQLTIQSDCENINLFCIWVNNSCRMRKCSERGKDNCTPLKIFSSYSELTLCVWNDYYPTQAYFDAKKFYDDQVIQAEEKKKKGEEVIDPVAPLMEVQAKCLDLNMLQPCYSIVPTLYESELTNQAKVCGTNRCSMDPFTIKCIDLPKTCDGTPNILCNMMVTGVDRVFTSKCTLVDDKCVGETLSMPPNCANYKNKDHCLGDIICIWQEGKCRSFGCSELGSATCELLVVMDKIDGGSVCMVDDATENCYAADPKILKVDNCQSRSYNSWAWDGQQCSPCTEGFAHSSAQLLDGIFVLSCLITMLVI